MAIHDDNSVESFSGFQKEIDKAGLAMVLDNLQVNQYQYPMESTVREVASNAVDAVKEKQIAIEILSGRAKEEDYYLRREEDIFQSSNFDASYFNLDWLDQENHNVVIQYEEGDQMSKDRIRFIDSGVGLGGKRLEGYFKLSWSSKRNSKDALGKFGIGAKSPLSTGVNSYKMYSRYNGQEFEFDIYSHKVDSAIGKFNDDGTINDYYEFENGFKAYYKKTTKKNGTEIVLETKKHHRQKYTDAVKSQLLYFKNVEFKILREHGVLVDIPFKAPILYEDDDIILSDNYQFSKPHLVIGREGSRVNYGYIDFLELELEDKIGNIGIKVASEDVAINPSRESVIWNDVTRKAVTTKFEKVVDIASNIVEESLNQTDFVEWLNACSNVVGGYVNSQSVLGRLSRIVDKSALKPSFKGKFTIKYGLLERMFPGFLVRTVNLSNEYRDKKNHTKVNRSPQISWSSSVGQNIYITEGSANPTKDIYLVKSSSRMFTLITIPSDEKLMELVKDTPSLKLSMLQDIRDGIVSLFKESSLVKDYDSVVIPDNWQDTIADILNGEEVVGENIITLTPAEKRELENRVVLYTLNHNRWRGDNRLFDNVKKEPKLGEIKEWKGTVIYGTQEDEELLHFTASLFDLQLNLYREDFKLVKISKQLVKHFKQHTHVKDFFLQIKNGTITMDSFLVSWHTGRLITEHLAKLPLLNNFSTINPEIVDDVAFLRNYAATHYFTLVGYSNVNTLGCNSKAYNELCSSTQNLIDFQVFVEENKDSAEDIAEKAKQLFSNEGVKNAKAVDLEIYNMLMEIVNYVEPIKDLLNHVGPLLTTDASISTTLETELKCYIDSKNLGPYNSKKPREQVG
jgi:hypothetical protein